MAKILICSIVQTNVKVNYFKVNKNQFITYTCNIHNCFFGCEKKIKYCKIPLICPGHIYRQRTSLMGLYLGAYIQGAYIWEEKHFNLQSGNLLFFLLFSSIKHVFQHL